MEHALVLDISSGNLSLGIVTKGKEAELTHAVRKKFSTDKVHGNVAMFEALDKGLLELFDKAKDKVKGVKYAVIALSSPWITPPLAKTTLLEESEVLESSVDKKLIDRVEKEVRKKFGVKSHFRFKSFLPLYFELKKDEIDENKLSIIAREGREESDAMLVSGGKIRRVEKLNFGKNTKIEEISKATGLPHELSRSMLYLHQSKMLEASVEAYVDNLLKKYEERERAIFSRLAKDADVLSIVDDPLLVLTEYASRLNWNKI